MLVLGNGTQFLRNFQAKFALSDKVVIPANATLPMMEVIYSHAPELITLTATCIFDLHRNLSTFPRIMYDPTFGLNSKYQEQALKDLPPNLHKVALFAHEHILFLSDRASSQENSYVLLTCSPELYRDYRNRFGYTLQVLTESGMLKT